MATHSGSIDEHADQEVSLTQLRKNIYQLVDEVIITGKPLTVKRQGCLLKLSVVSSAESKLGNLKSRNTIIGSIDDLEAEAFQHWESDNGFD